MVAKKSASKKAAKKPTRKTARKAAPKKKAAYRPTQEQVDLGRLTASDVQPFVKQVFTVRSSAGDIPIRLISCEESPAATMPGAPRTAFSMTFRSETDELRLAGDGGYDLSLEGFGTLPSVLISPIVRPGGQREGMFYQVCFG